MDTSCSSCQGKLITLGHLIKKLERSKSFTERTGDHGTKNGNYTCDNCSRARQELKRQKKKTNRQARLDDIGLETKRQVKDYPYDGFVSGGEKLVEHIHRRGDKSSLRSKNYYEMVREIEEKYAYDLHFDWRTLDDDDLDELLFKLRTGCPVGSGPIDDI